MQATRILPWFYASRPKTLTAALIPVLVGTVLSPSIEWSYSFFALIATVCIQIGTNLVNDSMDFTKGADTKERVGPLRATQMGWLTPQQVLAGGIACFFVAALFTIPLMEKGGWLVCVVLCLSILCGYFYTAGPRPLAYQGLGEIFVLLFFGWIGTFTMYYIQANELYTYELHEILGEHFWKAFLAGTQTGLLCTLIVALNNLRDQEQDRIAGKKTLAVKFGTKFAKAEVAFLSLTPFLLTPLWGFFGEPFTVVTWIFFPLALNIVMGAWKVTGRALNIYFYRAALLHLLFGCSLAMALLT